MGEYNRYRYNLLHACSHKQSDTLTQINYGILSTCNTHKHTLCLTHTHKHIQPHYCRDSVGPFLTVSPGCVLKLEEIKTKHKPHYRTHAVDWCSIHPSAWLSNRTCFPNSDWTVTFIIFMTITVRLLLRTTLTHPLPVSYSNRRKMCACFDSSRKSTPPRAPVHYGTWRKRQTTLCMSSPSACLGRVRWANPCASERQRRPRLRPLRVKVNRLKTRKDTHRHSNTQDPRHPHTFLNQLTLSFSRQWVQSRLGLLTTSWLIFV